MMVHGSPDVPTWDTIGRRSNHVADLAHGQVVGFLTASFGDVAMCHGRVAAGHPIIVGVLFLDFPSPTKVEGMVFPFDGQMAHLSYDDGDFKLGALILKS